MQPQIQVPAFSELEAPPMHPGEHAVASSSNQVTSHLRRLHRRDKLERLFSRFNAELLHFSLAGQPSQTISAVQHVTS